MNSKELCARWNVNLDGLKRLIGDKESLTAGEVDIIESRWNQELQASRQGWNAKLAERKAQTHET